MLKQINILIILLCALTIYSCAEDDNGPKENQDLFFGCCSSDPVFGPNINNLNQSEGEIVVDNLFTPNGDGFNDLLTIKNIELYNNHEVTIYTSTDEVVFQSTNYGGTNDYFPIGNQGQFGVEGLPDGTYKYKVTVENEDVFLESGTFCLFTQYMNLEQNFSACNPLENGFDPIITGN